MAKKKSMPKIYRVCPCCNGDGQVEITGVHRDTYFLLKRYQPITGAALSRIDGCHPEAMNNRLKRLNDLGLAFARKEGRQVFYSAWVSGEKKP